PRAAVLLFHRDAEQAHVAEFRPQRARELVCLVDLRGERGDLVGGEAAHAGAQLVGGLAEVEIERGEIIGDHGKAPLARPWLTPGGAARKDRIEGLPPAAGSATSCLRAGSETG